jgi:uncharacterized protein YceK
MRRLCAAVVVLIAIQGCATLGSQTSGVDGPIEWRALDLKLDRKDLSSPWVYSFTLELRNTLTRRITFTEMERKLYQPGTGSHVATTKGQWVVPAGLTLRLPMWSSLRCGGVEGNCSGTLMPIPLWKITFTGTDESGQDVRAVIDLRLPADPPRS